MNWQDILSIIIPIGAFMAWIYSRIDEKFAEVKTEIKDLSKDV